MATARTRREPDPARVPVGRRIREARSKKGLSQNQLARELDVTAGAVWFWEAGYTSPTMANFDEMATFLNVDREWLKTGHARAAPAQANSKAEERILELSRALTDDQLVAAISMMEGLAMSGPGSGRKRN